MALGKGTRRSLIAVLLLLEGAIASEQVVCHGRTPDDDHDPRPLANCNSTSCYRYYNDATAPYRIVQWPDIDFDTGEFYSGSVPIDEADPDRTLFFVFQPAIDKPVDEIVIWLNGGPGCSSLGWGFMAENGPFEWGPGTSESKHTRRPWAWAQTTNMLWVDQPVGTGFSTGKVEAHTEIGVGKDFIGFFKNFQKLFGIANYKIYVMGESYAGFYVPYISAAMLDQNDATYFDLSGALMYSPTIGDFALGGDIATYEFVKANNAILNINQTFLQHMEDLSSKCGYTDYLDKYLQYRPPGHQQSIFQHEPAECYIGQLWNNVQTHINYCFNGYHISDGCPTRSNLNGREWNAYYNRKDVKQAIHAPENVKWETCTFDPVFIAYHKNGTYIYDNSVDPTQGVLPQVIEATNRVLISTGAWDSVILSNQTLLAIQNMTWNGKLGFQEPPTNDFVVDIPHQAYRPCSTWDWGHGPQGVMGKEHYERGLQWVYTYQSGHEQPLYQPRAAYRHLQWVLGRIDTL